jgi:peptidoglycan hydrolase-like protein with peptidoglycan-binding domain
MQTLLYRTVSGQCYACQPGADDDSTLSITQSVGERGTNRAADVRTIQEALNRVDPRAGGPNPKLAVDGICGPLTKAAIWRFQSAHFGAKQADSRVDPNQFTIAKLRELSGSAAKTGAAPAAPTPGNNKGGPGDKVNLHAFVHMALYRVYPVITLIRAARTELVMAAALSEPKLDKDATPRSVNLAIGRNMAAVQRCFKLLGGHGQTSGTAFSHLSRIERVFVDIATALANTLIVPANDFDTGKADYVRIVSDDTLRAMHHKDILADATLGGWSQRNGNQARVRFNFKNLYSLNVMTTVIHEMAHFVSSGSTYVRIWDYGYYRKALSLSHTLMVSNAESYAWLAHFAAWPDHVLKDTTDLPPLAPL